MPLLESRMRKRLEKSMRPRTSPIGGMMTLSTSVVTILPNAAPMITPTARSMTLPREMNSRKLLQHGASWCGSDRSTPGQTPVRRHGKIREFATFRRVCSFTLMPSNCRDLAGKRRQRICNGSCTRTGLCLASAADPGTPHHVIQRGVNRVDIFRSGGLRMFSRDPARCGHQTQNRRSHLCVDDQPCPSHRHSAG